MRQHLTPIVCICWLALAVSASSVMAENGPPVGVTEVTSVDFDSRLSLTGTVRSQRSSVVAAEVAGLVAQLAAREGDFVQRGAPLARLRQTTLEIELTAREAELAEAEARLDLATQNLDRARDLFESGVTSRQDLDAAESESTAWRGRIDRLEAEIARARDNLTRSVIPAPFSGFVTRERTQVGEWLAVGDPVMEILDLEEPEVVVDAPERHFGRIRKGSDAIVTFDALPGVRMKGRVAAIIPAADPLARTFPVKIRFPNREHTVATGMLARVNLRLGDSGPGLAVPKDALLEQPTGFSVVRLTDGGTLEAVAVTAGRAGGQWIEVAGDLAAGDKIVTRGNERVRPGQSVEATSVEYPLP
jgi:RND family efflux transporter MFP subunit